MTFPWGVVMETLGSGYPFRTAHFIETLDPKFASVGPRIITSGQTNNAYTHSIINLYVICVFTEASL